MYTVLMLLLIGLGVVLLGTGLSSERLWLAALGIVVFLATAALFGLMGFWGEMLWFQSVGYVGRFWTAVFGAVTAAAIGGLVGGLLVAGLTWIIPKHPPVARVWPESLGVVFGLVWGTQHWETVLRYWYGVTTDVRDPILGLDTGFYLFSLPFYDALYGLLLLVSLTGMAAAVAYLMAPRGREEIEDLGRQQWPVRVFRDYRAAYFNLGGVGVVLGVGQWLNIYHLMYSEWGAVSGPGWTDVTIRLPAYGLVAVFTIAVGAALMVPPLARRLHGWATGEPVGSPVVAFGLPVLGVAAVWFLALGLAPGLVQWLVVEPNEITKERPYIAHNIEFTRRGFQLDKVEEREFPVAETFTRQAAQRNEAILSQVRLWDPRALVEVYKQFQEIRLYYQFPDVDIDRYTIDGRYRQVMVSPREMQLANLPEQSQTFVNRHFKYTHGYGLTMAPVSEFTPDGLPDLLIKNLPPEAESPDLKVDQPAIYYGLMTDTYAVVNSAEEEFDYPRGQQNAYVRYAGTGGVQLSNLWRTFLYGWKLGGTRLFLSDYPTADSRIMFHRQIHDRVKTLAPFLQFDRDPYVVLADGKLYWIIDAYTTSDYYPYSEPFLGRRTSARRDAAPAELHREEGTAKGPPPYLRGANYMRNSVKAVVDAYSGSVDFYVFEPDDPLIQVWDRVFPGLLKPRDEMPEELVAHVRYPEDFLLVQGLVYAKYHMTDPSVFYNQEDLWVRATEKYYGTVQPVEPYYVMWKPPESDGGSAQDDGGEGAMATGGSPRPGDAEFIQMLPFTPKNRQVLIGWIAGMCDQDNYGRLLAYRFPKEKRVLGTQQVETKIDQDSHLSGQLTLWDQRGSNVIRGNVLVIPIDDTLLYVEPIYLQAEAAAYPELRLVALMHNDRLSYAETFEEAIEGLYGERREPKPPPTPTEPAQPPAEQRAIRALARQAGDAFDDYLEALAEKRFRDAGDSLQKLSRTLQQLEQQAGGPTLPTDQPSGAARKDSPPDKSP